jgi:hypothetical protein
MKFVALLLILIALNIKANDEDISISYPEGNQILFAEKGHIINKITFAHVTWTMDMRPPLDALMNITASLEHKFKSEMAKANRPVKTFTVAGNITTIWNDEVIKDLYTERTLDGAMVCLTLLEMFYRIHGQIDSLLRSVPEKYNINQSQDNTLVHQRVRREAIERLPEEFQDVFDFLDLNVPTSDEGFNLFNTEPFSFDNDLMYLSQNDSDSREKREVLGGLALAGVVWNAFKINRIETHLETLSKKYNVVVDSVSLISAQQGQIAADLVLMKRLLQVIAGNDYRKILASSISTGDRLRDSVENIVAIVTSGRQRRVSPRLINGDSLAELFLNLQRRSEFLNSDLLLKHPTDIYDVQASYGYDKEGLLFRIYAHIPFADKLEKLAVSEHLPFPLAYQSMKENQTITPDTGPDRYLAVIPDSSASDGHRYRVLNEAEFQSCFKIRDFYLCSGRNTLRTDIYSSCIGSLWLQKQNLVVKNCNMKLEPLREVAVKVSPRKWLVFSPRPESYSTNCGKGVIKSLRFEPQTLVTLIEDCELDLESHHLSTDVNVMVNFKVETREWRFYGSVFPPKEEVVEFDLNKAIDEAIAVREKVYVGDLTHLKHDFNATADPLTEVWKAISNLNLFSWFGNVYTFFIYVIVLYITYLAVVNGWFKKCFCPKRRQYELQSAPIIRPARAPIIRYNSAPQKIVEELEFPSPPPYVSVVDEKTPSAPLLDPDDVSDDSKCLIKHTNGQDPKDFICHHHDPINGCSGSYPKKASKKSRK